MRNSFVPLAAIYRRARLAGRVTVDPTTDLPLPTSGTRARAAPPQEAEALLTGLPWPDIWAAAFYSGLRLGELRALRVRRNVRCELSEGLTAQHEILEQVVKKLARRVAWATDIAIDTLDDEQLATLLPAEGARAVQ